MGMALVRIILVLYVLVSEDGHPIYTLAESINSCPEGQSVYYAEGDEGEQLSFGCNTTQTIKLESATYKGMHLDIDDVYTQSSPEGYCSINVEDENFPPFHCNNISMYYMNVTYQCSDDTDNSHFETGQLNEMINLLCSTGSTLTSAYATIQANNYHTCHHCVENLEKLIFSNCIEELNCSITVGKDNLTNECLSMDYDFDIVYCCMEICDPYPDNTAYDVSYYDQPINGKYPHGTEINIECKSEGYYPTVPGGNTSCSDGRWFHGDITCQQNIAFRKTARQSSTGRNEEGFNGSASRAVDGINRRCSHTVSGNEPHPWWQVDLEHEYNIRRVTIVNTDNPCCMTRLKEAAIYVGSEWHQPPLFTEYDRCGQPITKEEAENGGVISRTCNNVTVGRYVSVRSDQEYVNKLQLCEVMVFGERTSEDTTIEALSTIIVTNENVEDVAKDLSEAIERLVDSSKAVDIQATQSVFVKIVDVGSSSPNITENVVKSISCILNANISTDSQSNLDIANSSSMILKAVEKQISQTLKVHGRFASSKPNIVVEGMAVTDIPTQGDDTANFEVARNDMGFIDGKTEEQGAEVSIQVPRNALDGSNDRISFISYKDDKLFRSKTLEEKNNTIRVLGPIISADILGKNTRNLPQPVVIRITPTQDEAASLALTDSLRCVYWDFNLRHGIGDWAEDGCVLKPADSEGVTCNCNHLTNFAVLVDASGQGAAGKASFVFALDIISKVGCAVSIVALCITLLIFLLSSKLRLSLQRKILVQFCFAMLFLYLSFLIGIDSKSPSVCFFVGLLLHYFVLATIFWMGVEARHMYITLVSDSDRVGRRFLKKAGVFAWGGALIPVCVVALVKQDGYLADTYCFLMPGYGLYFGLLCPIALVLLHNIVTFVLVAKILLSAKSYKLKPDPEAKATDESSSGDVAQRLLNAFAVSVILGITWAFGFLAVEEARGAFQLLFCIFNSFQGVLIFILFCYAQKDVRKLLIEKCCVEMAAQPMPKKPKKVVKHGAVNQGQTGVSGSTLITGESCSDENDTLVTKFDDATMAKSTKQDKEKEIELQRNKPAVQNSDTNVSKHEETTMNQSVNTEETSVNLTSETSSA